MQVKAKEVLNWHPIEGRRYITQGTVYPVLAITPRGVMLILDDDGGERPALPWVVVHMA